MRIKALVIAALSVTSICTASMQHKEKYVNKSIRVDLENIEFRTNGMFLAKNALHAIRLSDLACEGNDYYAHYRIDYICGGCGKKYTEDPGVCRVCGSEDIRERELDLWPIG